MRITIDTDELKAKKEETKKESSMHEKIFGNSEKVLPDSKKIRDLIGLR